MKRLFFLTALILGIFFFSLNNYALSQGISNSTQQGNTPSINVKHNFKPMFSVNGSKVKNTPSSNSNSTYPYGNFSYYFNPYEDYYNTCTVWGSNVIHKALNNWKYSASTKSSATAEFSIDRTGRVSSIRFQKSSGDSAFDNSVIRAIRSSEPFEVMPTGCVYNSVVIDFVK